MSQIRPSTHDAVLSAAFQVFYDTPTASLADVAAAAGVGRATLHRHFASRSDLIAAMSDCANKDIDAAILQATQDAHSSTEALRRSLTALIPLGDRQWFLSHEHKGLSAKTEDDADLIAAIDTAKTEGSFDPHTPSVWIAAAYNNLIFTAWSLVRDGEATPKQAAELAWRTLTSGLKGPAT